MNAETPTTETRLRAMLENVRTATANTRLTGHNPRSTRAGGDWSHVRQAGS